ncbi:Peptidyl-prolyl cis-trans isomerase cyp15 [Dimargaris verticillata]|uniref:peptidylprolyl isomerase n=1 Tax=Dimargaris verticillata TaxID=2761393 RepID=A0A9W8EAP1_9FUNG|nr:Peptidyl-prolyl cis-trans isomerase cyp15 [Dimargaris verticillata]
MADSAQPSASAPDAVRSKHVEKTSNHNSSDDDSDAIGPLPPTAAAQPKKKRRVLHHEQLYVDELPSAEMYERSYMHRDVVNNVVVSCTDFVVTTSVDGHVKFWKKTVDGIEFVKHYRAHLGTIVGVSLSADGLLFATASADKTLKVYDVVNFDMINMIQLDFTPAAVCWLHRQGQAQALVACADRESSAVTLFDGRGDGTPAHVVSTVHAHPVQLLAFNPVHNCVLSIDERGMFEYWVPEPPFELPLGIEFRFKTETDLYEFKKHKSVPVSLSLSPDYSKFITLSADDRQVRVFNFTTGKLLRKYDESLQTISEMQQAGTSVHKLDAMEFGRRLALDREIEASVQARFMNAVFDQSGHFVLYPTLLGIKVVNLVSNKVVRLLGKSEPTRFLNLALYQGIPAKSKPKASDLTVATSDNPLFKEGLLGRDPTLFTTAYKRNRFYLFTQRDPHATTNTGDRDVFNEKPSREEQTLAVEKPLKQLLGSSAVIHSTMGDIYIKLMPDIAPKAVENFVTHARQGYYDNIIFHRVIKGFMLQTGDPLGDGTGGESIWGDDFEDEFNRDVRHDRPYTVSMANAGPNSNGSQFFITVVPTPWLDNKHTIFGRVTSGMDVVHSIENVKVDKGDKPYDNIHIVSIDVR